MVTQSQGSASEASEQHPEPSKRPPSAWRTLRLLVILLVIAVSMLMVGRRYGDRMVHTIANIWHDIVGGEAAADDGGTGQFFTCGMHPWVILPNPGLCPICHMDLTPLDASKFTGEIVIDPVVVQNIGVRTELVEQGPVVANVRTVGMVGYDETRLQDINLRVSGWIETLDVDYLGAPVAKGQPLFTLYSPALYSAQQEYLLALRQVDSPVGSSPVGSSPVGAKVPSMGAGSAESLRAARLRLILYGIDDEQIAELERAGEPQRTVVIKSPSAGTVIEKMAIAGMKVDPGMKLFRIADLSKVWVTATVYEYQLPFVALGQSATMSLAYIAGETFEGTVDYIYPWVDKQTRQANVRLVFDNQDGRLKPGTFANLNLQRTLAEERTLMSRSAVIDTGERQVTLVSLGAGRFEPRDLTLGLDAMDGRVEVLAGVSVGERVVTSAQFLLDSESNIRQGLMRMLGTDLLSNKVPVPAGPALASLPADLAKSLSAALAAYLRMGDQLAADSMTGVGDAARELATITTAMQQLQIPDQQHFWHQHMEAMQVHDKATQIAAVADIAAVRTTYADLSVAFAKLLRVTGIPAAYPSEVQELHCPMFLEAKGGAFWLQHSGRARNPYFGSEMLTCFDTQEPMPEARSSEGSTAAAPGAVVLDAAQVAAVDQMVAAYLQATTALVLDRTEGVSNALSQIGEQANALAAVAAPVGELAKAVAATLPAQQLDLEALRKALPKVSEAVMALLRVAPPGQRLVRAHCPMVDASWLQVGEGVQNPYMGSSMPACGTIEETFPVRAPLEQGR